MKTVIFEDSYSQLKNVRMSLEKLSKSKLIDLLNEDEYGIDEQRIVHMTSIDYYF